MQEKLHQKKYNKRFRFFANENDKNNFKIHYHIKGRDKNHKNILYSTLNPYEFISIIDDDTKLGLFKIRIQNINTYNGEIPKSIIKDYLVFDKNKKRVRKSSNWFYQIFPPIINKNNFLVGNRFEWLIQANNKYHLHSVLTTNILNKIFKGEFTNPNDLFKTFLKEKGLSKISESDFLNSFKIFSTKYTNPDYGFFVSFLKNSSKYERDVKFINNIIDAPHIEDLIYLCKITKTKINFNWSHKRLKDLHDKLSKYVSTIKASNMKIEYIQYKKDIPKDISNSFKLLKTNKEFFIEGDELNHCVFSNGYFNIAKNKEIFILKYDGEFGRGTAEISFYENINLKIKEFRIHQFYGFGNKPMKHDFEAKQYLKEFLNNDEVMDWWMTEISTKTKKFDVMSYNELPF